ncbi:MAG: DUF2182 domain-containing protein [Pseudomonadota bacterium]
MRAITTAPGRALSRGGGFWLGIYALLAAAWLTVWVMDPRAALPAELRGLGAETIAALCLAAVRDASFLGLWLMWAVMAAAMMLPTALPAVRIFADFSETVAARRPEAASALALPALASGFLAVWAGFAVAAALGQIALSQGGYIAFGADAVNSPGVAAILLLLAGLWQFSALKEACLRRCRLPGAYFVAAWRPGARAAFGMGGKLGLHCLGCCWALMLLAFVGGTTNLLFMAGATLLMMLEKLPEIGRPLTRPLGALLIAAGAGTGAYAVVAAT